MIGICYGLGEEGKMWWLIGALVVAVIAVWAMAISQAVVEKREQLARIRDGEDDPFEP